MRRIAAASVLSCVISACASNGKESSVPAFYKKNSSAIQAQLQGMLSSNHENYILHVHFRGNDFGGKKSAEKLLELAPGADHPLRHKNHPFQTLSLNQGDGALELSFNYTHPQILGTLRYRHESKEKALRAMQSLFACSNGSSQNLDQVLVVASGGSHGADEVDQFVKAFKALCGKDVDAVLLGDAVLQGGETSLKHLKNLPSQAPCLNFYRVTHIPFIPHGVAVDNCYNVSINNGSHDVIQQSAMFFMNDLLAEYESMK